MLRYTDWTKGWIRVTSQSEEINLILNILMKQAGHVAAIYVQTLCLWLGHISACSYVLPAASGFVFLDHKPLTQTTLLTQGVNLKLTFHTQRPKVSSNHSKARPKRIRSKASVGLLDYSGVLLFFSGITFYKELIWCVGFLLLWGWKQIC